MEQVTPQVLFTVFGLPIRDTVVSTWIMMVFIAIGAIIVGRRRPTALEMLVDFLDDTFYDIMGGPATPYLPLLGSLTIFIAIANVIGVVPFLISPTKDINAPLALALVVFFSVHYFGVRAKGIVTYFKDLASPIFLLPMEIIGQLSRTLSLTLRLFGNIVSGELIVAIIFALAPLFVPLPLVGLSLLTGILQAYIFAVLAATYIAAGVEIGESVPEE